jgi:hypothetical protein
MSLVGDMLNCGRSRVIIYERELSYRRDLNLATAIRAVTPEVLRLRKLVAHLHHLLCHNTQRCALRY